jgi:ATP-dependent DNA helicase PIF1
VKGVLQLSQEQQEIFQAVKNGTNVFITAGGGFGKSFLLKFIAEHFRKQKVKVAVTALTGLAAFHISGTTLHSWCGIGRGETEAEMEMAWKQKYKWRRTKILIIDEISMMSGQLFDRLNELAKKIRKQSLPFGEAQNKN